MKTGYFIGGLLALAAMMVSCQKNMEVKVNASFTTDKDVYEVYEQVVITNTTVVENAQMAICQWELGEGKVSYDFTPEDVSFDTEGEYTIRLTVTSDVGSVKGSFEKRISVIDSNVKPVADFSWEPQEIVAGEPVVFTDMSTDEDGTIVSREWTFGSTVVQAEGKDMEYTFVSYGQIDVTLKVTDDKRGTASKTVTVEVAKGADYLELLWERPYDDVEDAYVYGTSPATSPDGQSIYVSSTGYHLVSFDTEGNENWRFDIGKDGASALGNDGTIRHQSPTPSVDDMGVVYIASGFDEPKAAKGALYAVSGDSGEQKWHVDLGTATSSRFMSPCLTEDYVIISNRNCSNWSKWQVQVFDRQSGIFVTDMHANSGSYGGMMALKNGMIICATGGKWGYRLYYPDGEGKWKFAPDNATGSNDYNLGTQDTPNGAQPAMSADGKVYLLMDNTAGKVTGGGILYCFDSGSFKYDVNPQPEWTAGIKGDVPQSGLGCVVGEDGTVYVTSASGNAEKAYVTAVSASGDVLWESAADGNINGVAAVDSDGCIYYKDSGLGKLVRLSASDGSRMAELKLCDEMRTSPTIAADGVIYVTGMKDGKPVLFAVQGFASGHTDSWSQLGGNPQKTECMY